MLTVGTEPAGHRLQGRDLVSEPLSDDGEWLTGDEDGTEGLVTALRRLPRREEVLAAEPILHGADPSRLISCASGMAAERTPKWGPEKGSEAALPCVEPWK
jgi:hypothetical protein